MAKRKTARHLSFFSMALLLAAPASAASSASSASLTLSNFETLGSVSVMNCIFAYNTPIRGCTVDDFTNGNTCSDACVSGLQAVQFDIRSACASVTPTSGSLLAQVMKGNIVGTLCKDGTSVSLTSTPKASATPTSTKSRSTSTKGRSSQTSTTSSDTASDTAASATDVASTDSSTDTATATATTTAQQTSAGDSTSTSSADSPKKTSQPGSGGGSPFDFVASMGTSTQRQGTAAVIGVAMAVVGFALT